MVRRMSSLSPIRSASLWFGPWRGRGGGGGFEFVERCFGAGDSQIRARLATGGALAGPVQLALFLFDHGIDQIRIRRIDDARGQHFAKELTVAVRVMLEDAPVPNLPRLLPLR